MFLGSIEEAIIAFFKNKMYKTYKAMGPSFLMLVIFYESAETNLVKSMYFIVFLELEEKNPFIVSLTR